MKQRNGMSGPLSSVEKLEDILEYWNDKLYEPGIHFDTNITYRLMYASKIRAMIQLIDDGSELTDEVIDEIDTMYRITSERENNDKKMILRKRLKEIEANRKNGK